MSTSDLYAILTGFVAGALVSFVMGFVRGLRGRRPAPVTYTREQIQAFMGAKPRPAAPEGMWWRPWLVIQPAEGFGKPTRIPDVTGLSMPQPGWIKFTFEGTTVAFERLDPNVRIVELQYETELCEGAAPWWAER